MPLTRKSTRSKTRKNTNRGRFIGPRRSSAGKPARFAVSRPRYNKNKSLASALSNMAETKLLPVTAVNEAGGLPIQGGAQVYYWAGVMNSVPNGWDSNLVDLAGIQHSKGVDANERDGNYVYFKKTHVTMQVDLNQSSAAYPPVEFRLIVCKARQAVTPSGVTDPPQTTMFLDNVGNAIGHVTSGVTGMDIMLQPLNKRDWVIYRDQKFTLTAPQDVNGGGFNSKYPSRKNIFLNLKYFAKTKMNSSSNKPEDLDTHYLIYLYASSIGKDRLANLFEVSLRGTTSFTDI